MSASKDNPLDLPLPPCGLYRTTQAIGSVPAGKLVYFHNHGEPGPGVYLPESWKHNRAVFSKRGTTVTDEDLAHTLEPLPSQGFYVVQEPFWCCAGKHRQYQADELVQLGYNKDAHPILFSPELIEGQLAIPELGTGIDRERMSKLRPVTIRESKGASQAH